MPKLVITYLLVQAFSLVAFWAVLDSAHALGYTILFIGIIQPLTILVLSFLITKKNYPGNLYWLAAPVFGLGFMLLPYCTFDLANMLTTSSFLAPSWIMFLVGALLSAIGLLAGTFLRAKNA